MDVTVRYKVGSVRVLIAFECRDHQRIQDVMWIEQLATKRVSLCATQIVGVSASGFSEDALAAAKLHDVQLRQLSVITKEDFFETWFPARISHVKTTVDAVSCRFTGPPQLAALPEFAAGNYNDRVFSLRGSPERYSINDIVRELANHNDGVAFVSLGREAPVTRYVTFAPEMSMHLAGSEWPISDLTIGLKVETTSTPLEVTSAQTYLTPGAELVHVARAALDVTGSPRLKSAHIAVAPERKEVTIEIDYAPTDGEANVGRS